MSIENNELYKDEMWEKISYYVKEGLIYPDEYADLSFEELVRLVEKIEKGSD